MARNEAKELGWSVYDQYLESASKGTIFEQWLHAADQDYVRNPAKWDKALDTSNREKVRAIATQIWTDDNIRSRCDPSQLELCFSIAGVQMQPTLTYPDEKSSTGTGRIKLKHATLRHYDGSRQLIREQVEKDQKHLAAMDRAFEEMLRRAKGRMNTKLKDIADEPISIAAE